MKPSSSASSDRRCAPGGEVQPDKLKSWARRHARQVRQTPLRLDEEERGMLRLLEGALKTSDYVDKVDLRETGWGGVSSKEKIRRMRAQLVDVLSILSGLRVAGATKGGITAGGGGKGGANVLAKEGTNLASHAEWFARVFEVGRRYKMLNPARLRATFGSLCYLLQDACLLRRRAVLGFELVHPIRTVATLLEEAHGPYASDDGEGVGLELLADERLGAAVVPIAPEWPREQIEAATRARRAAREALVGEYGAAATAPGGIALPEHVVLRALDSLTDGLSHVATNERPVARMLQHLGGFCGTGLTPALGKRPALGWWAEGNGDGGMLLGALAAGAVAVAASLGGWWWAMPVLVLLARHRWLARAPERPQSLAIRAGRGGACFTHSHGQQAAFVRQTLTLWREVTRRMVPLWFAAGDDLCENDYALVDTGQGAQRLQAAPALAALMQHTLATVKSECGPWVGLSVVHLGDRDVPNALFFIDKYCQLSRILHPVASTVDALPALFADGGGNPALRKYLRTTYGSAEEARNEIVGDFFRHGFDGSGDDGGSCIDGRLTSAWNWCQQLESKYYFPLFQLTGFEGFDGDFRADAQ
jgi:hypothetical protein